MKAYLLRFPGEWERTLMIGRLQVRLGNMQQAAWWHKGDNTFAELFSIGRRVSACRRAAG